MPATVDSLLSEVKGLSIEDQIQLVDAIMDNLNPVGDLPFNPEWLVECKRRVERIKSGEEKVSSWEEVRDRARKAVGLTNG